MQVMPIQENKSEYVEHIHECPHCGIKLKDKNE